MTSQVLVIVLAILNTSGQTPAHGKFFA
jgi:hypothetical protein